MSWLLMLIVVNINNPNDIPGRLSLEFRDQASCEYALNSMTYQLKFNNFKVIGKCEKKYSS